MIRTNKLQESHCLIFRDKLLLPSEGFIPTHYRNFNKLKPVYVANKFDWRANDIKEKKILTVQNSLAKFWFKQTGNFNLAIFDNLAPVVVHAHFGRGGALALPIAKKLELPLYVTYHGGDATKHTHQSKKFFPTIYQKRLKMLQTYASGFLCVSKFIMKRLEEQGFPKHKLILHYIGINCDKLVKPEKKNGPLLFAGRLTDKKGVDNLILAMHKIKNLGVPQPILDIVGSGPQEVELKKLACGLKNVRFLGWQTPLELQKLMAKATAVIVPSREADNGDCEGLPTVVLEAIRAGAIVLASNHAGIPEIIQHEVTGLLTPENDTDALAHAIANISENSHSMLSLATKAQKRLKDDFDSMKQSRRLEKILLGDIYN